MMDARAYSVAAGHGEAICYPRRPAPNAESAGSRLPKTARPMISSAGLGGSLDTGRRARGRPNRASRCFVRSPGPARVCSAACSASSPASPVGARGDNRRGCVGPRPGRRRVGAFAARRRVRARSTTHHHLRGVVRTGVIRNTLLRPHHFEEMGVVRPADVPMRTRTGLLAIKCGMTREWNEHGVSVPLTVLWVDDCQVRARPTRVRKRHDRRPRRPRPAAPSPAPRRRSPITVTLASRGIHHTPRIRLACAHRRRVDSPLGSSFAPSHR